MRKTYFFIILLLAIGLSSRAQSDSLVFPAAWQGHWVGDLVISTVQGEVQRVPMSLHLDALPDGRYTYTIVYGEETPEKHAPLLPAGRGGQPRPLRNR